MGGTIDRTDTWGRRKLAYEIGHQKEGFYVLEVISGSGELMKEIDRRLKVTEGLLRHLIVRVDESTIKAERMRSKRTEESRRRRIARGLPPDRQPGEGPQGEDSDDSGDMMFDVADMEN
jgi:small subunit ribosomal protein S6